MMTQTQLEALRPELEAWNAAIRRARHEYNRQPLIICAHG